MLRIVASVGLFGWVGLLSLCGNCCIAAEKARISESIRKAQGFLLKQKLTAGAGAIAGLALVKSGADRNALVIQEVVREITEKVKTGNYSPLQMHVYEAAVDLMLLEALDQKLFRPQIEAATSYLIGSQFPNGSWYYPTRPEPDCGDTSITQYALIGLWAATRAGVEVPTEVWEKAAQWQIGSLQPDGGFCYHPFDGKIAASPDYRLTCCTMTAAGSSNLLIARRILFGELEIDGVSKQSSAKRRFGVLEKFVDETPVVKREVKMRAAAIDNALKESVRWTSKHFGEKSPTHERWYAYDLYCIERVSALLDIEKLDSHDWYNEGADELLAKQAVEGSWNDSCGPVASTALGILFLTKVTSTVIQPKQKINVLGVGLQAGGRGLPDNLNAVQMKDGNVVARKIVGPVDNLLIELERSSNAKVEDIQAAVVDAVQLDKPEELIGQVERLRRLAADPRLEVRRTAIWALGRSGDVSATPSLILGLADSDLSIAREASLALNILSRRPEGCNKAIDPTDDTQMGLSAEATDAERQVAIDAWRAESIRRWTEWYHKNRLYDDRDDRTTLKKSK